MNPRFRDLIIGVIVICAALALWWWFFALREVQQLEIRSPRGNVQVNGMPATVGMKIPASGAEIVTGPDGFVNLVMTDGSTSQLVQGSKLRIIDARQDTRGKSYRSAFQLDAGEIIREVPKAADIKRESNLVTRTANIGVRGTLYVVTSESAGTGIMVHRGAVATQGQIGTEAPLPENYGTRVVASAAPEAASVLPPPPALAQPEKGARHSAASIRFAWNPVPEGLAYLLEVASDETFNSLVMRRVVATNSFDLDTLPEDGRFFWRIKTVDGRKLQGRGSEPRILHYKYHHESGRSFIAQGKAKEALAALRLAEKGYPNDASVLSDVGWGHYINAELDSAKSYLDRSITVDKSDVGTFLRRGRVHYWLKKLELARKDYETVLATSNQDPDANWGLAEVEIAESKMEFAFRRLDELLSRYPDHVYAAMTGAKAAFERGDLVRTQKYLASELRARPDNVEALRLQDAMQLGIKK